MPYMISTEFSCELRLSRADTVCDTQIRPKYLISYDFFKKALCLWPYRFKASPYSKEK